jgi:hypothetical protein
MVVIILIFLSQCILSIMVKNKPPIAIKKKTPKTTRAKKKTAVAKTAVAKTTRAKKKTAVAKTAVARPRTKKASSNKLIRNVALGVVGGAVALGAGAYMAKRAIKVMESNKFVKNLTTEGSNTKRIPKIIHQIWIGNESLTPKHTESWRNWCKNSGWEYKLWGNADIDHIVVKNKSYFDKATAWAEKADIMRYEIMYYYGGFYADADMYCYGHDLEKYLDLKSGFIGVFEPYMAFGMNTIGEPYVANGFFAVSPQHPIIKRVIDSIPAASSKRSLLERTGPVLFNSCINSPITIMPSSWVFPLDFRFAIGKDPEKAIGEFKDKALVYTFSGYDVLNKSAIFRKIKAEIPI